MPLPPSSTPPPELTPREAALAAVFEQRRPQLLREAHQRGEHADAEDVVQDVLFYFWRRRADFDVRYPVDEAQLTEMMFREVNSRVATRRRSRYRWAKRMASYEQHVEDVSRVWMDPESAMEYGDVTAAHDSVVARMTPYLRRAYQMCMESGLTYSAAAAVIGCKTVTVKGAVSDALRFMREQLGGEPQFTSESQRLRIQRLARRKESK